MNKEILYPKTIENLKEKIKDEKFSLQVWKHDKIVDSIVYNLLSNHYSMHNIEITEVVE